MVYSKGSTRSEAKPIFWIEKANVFAKSERVQKLAIIISNLPLFSKFSGSLTEFAYHIANLSSVAESSDTSHGCDGCPPATCLVALTVYITKRVESR